MTYKIDTIKRITAEECFRRLMQIKRSYANRSQVLLYDAEINCLSIDLCSEQEFYSRPINFDDDQFMKHIISNKQLFDRSNFIASETKKYVSGKKDLCKSFAITAMIFTKYRKPDAIQKHAIICMGSLYHSPRIFYKDFSANVVRYEKLASYLDLY